MVCAHCAEFNNMFSCKHFGDGEHCAHKFIDTKKKKKKEEKRPKLSNINIWLVSFVLALCREAGTDVCAQFICLRPSNCLSIHCFGCRLWVCSDVHSKITMKLILKSDFVFRLIFVTFSHFQMVWTANFHTVSYLLFHSIGLRWICICTHTHYAWTASNIFFLWIRVCFFLFFFVFRFFFLV